MVGLLTFGFLAHQFIDCVKQELALAIRVLFGYDEGVDYETIINEPVKVWVFFDHGIFPIAMRWQRRLIKFEKLIFSGRRKVGQTEIIDLVCASDTANFELEYNSDNYSWKVKRVMPIS